MTNIFEKIVNDLNLEQKDVVESGRLPVNRTMKYLKILRATFHLMKSSFFAYSRDNFRAISWWIMF